MAIENKRLGASSPSATTWTTLYTTSGVSAIVRGLSICNRSTSDITVSVACYSSGEAATDTDRCIMNSYSVLANTTAFLSYGIGTSDGDTLAVYTSAATASFVAWGAEVSAISDKPKRLGGVAPSATTNTSLYAVPTNTITSVSTINVCNRGVAGTFRVAHVDAAIGSVANEDYILYDCVIEANDTIAINMPISMSATHSILVYASHTDFTFMAWGSEIL